MVRSRTSPVMLGLRPLQRGLCVTYSPILSEHIAISVHMSPATSFEATRVRLPLQFVRPLSMLDVWSAALI